ncbi:MAG: class I SAM-dependent methyltransferase [bacterium]
MITDYSLRTKNPAVYNNQSFNNKIHVAAQGVTNLLDLGCGTGGLTRILKPSGEVVLLDRDKAVLEKALMILAGEGYQRIQTMNQDVRDPLGFSQEMPNEYLTIGMRFLRGDLSQKEYLDLLGRLGKNIAIPDGSPLIVVDQIGNNENEARALSAIRDAKHEVSILASQKQRPEKYLEFTPADIPTREMFLQVPSPWEPMQIIGETISHVGPADWFGGNQIPESQIKPLSQKIRDIIAQCQAHNLNCTDDQRVDGAVTIDIPVVLGKTFLTRDIADS